MNTFRFRLNCIDHYQATPTDLDPVLRRRADPSRREHVPQVSVIRVFGATETGQKVCAHIHGALPYLYIEYEGSLDKDEVKTYIASLRTSIDHALASTYRRNPHDSRSVYVGHISLIKGVPYYGYHVGYKFFLKIYLLNPLHMTRFTDLLHQGAILSRVFQPYESHLQYLLQWMCDYNLYGCAYIDCAKVQFRGPVPDSEEIDVTTHKWHDESIPAESMANPDRYPRQSHCTLEVDVCVQDILNRHELCYRPMHHNFNEQSYELGPDEKYMPSLAGLWKEETRRRKLRMGLTNPSSSPFPTELLVSMSATSRSTEKAGWIHEDEFRELVDGLIKSERGKNPAVKARNFIKPIPGEEKIPTAFQSVEDLYPGNVRFNDLLNDADLRQQEKSVENVTIDKLSEVNLGFEAIGDAAGNTNDAGTHSDTEEEPSMDPLSVSEAFTKSLENVAATEELLMLEKAKHIDSAKSHSTAEIDVTLKRVNSFGSQQHNKRQRIGSAQDTTPRVSFSQNITHGNKDISKLPQRPVGNDTPHASQQSSIKARGRNEPSTHSFPVVKNPSDPSTILRLSQSDYSNSQEVLKTPVAKNLSSRKTYETPAVPGSSQKKSSFGYGSNTTANSSDAVAVVKQLARTSDHSANTLYFGTLPPTIDDLEETWADTGLPPVIYQDAFYSDEKDVPKRPREYAGREFRLQSNTVPYLPHFDFTGESLASFGEQPPVIYNKAKEDAEIKLRQKQCTLRNWELATAPPSFKSVEEWLQEEQKQAMASVTAKAPRPENKPNRLLGALSQIEGPTQKNKHDFKFSPKKKSASVKHETQYMSIMSLEVHVNSRGALVPDPAQDEIQCVFWCVERDEESIDGKPRVGVLCLSDENGIARRIAKQTRVEVEYEEDELDLINRVVDIVRHFDPDIMTGYEVHNCSWGYLIERARMKYEYNLCDELSRVKTLSEGNFGKEADRWGFTHTSTIRIIGRHMINLWRAMRGELNLLQYTMENVVFHLLHKRIPHYQHADLTTWYRSPKPRDLAKVLEYFITRVQLNLDILEANDIVPRTSEQARLLGVDFFSVISRGSQYKVESTMFRIAKPENFILVSPSRKQVGRQNALECLPLVMEPRSDFYTSPVVVLDFQSLYPSVMIAYNYCYSTCLGRIVPWRGQNKMGFMDFKREPQILELVKDQINIAPNGMMYVKPEMRKSLLAKMLGELLDTRVMVKSGMKQDKDDKTLQQLLNNRQLALKLLANVTYGYTSASFSGRMPCSEIADSIVQTGRETLEKAIALIHSVERWGAEVVYGDTDSLFIHLKGRTRDQAFTIGEEIADVITKSNPKPIKLKFEKVYHPCVLMAKKRYVGFKYESRHQTEPEFDAKGIETVRRDGTPAEQKIEETALKMLFRTSDLSQVKRYFQAQCTKIMQGRVSIQDFLFAKEVKLGTYSDRGPPPPGALIAAKRMLADPRTEPQYGERIPYVVVTGAPGARLSDRCVSPETVLLNDHVELDAEYYITKNLIPPLERIFNLVGANVRQWYDEMPKIQRIRNIALPMQHLPNHHSNANNGRAGPAAPPPKKITLESYMTQASCLLCRAKLPPSTASTTNITNNTNTTASAYARLPLCPPCLRKPARTLLRLRDTMRAAELRVRQVDAVCRSCSNLPWGDEIRCDSRDCPVFYTRLREGAKLAVLRDSVGRVVEVVEDEGVRRFEEECRRVESEKGKGKGKGKGQRKTGKRNGGVRAGGLEW